MAQTMDIAEFWRPASPDRRIAGSVSIQEDSSQLVTLNAKLIEEKANPYQKTQHGFARVVSLPEHLVEDGREHLLLADTENGPITCLKARLKHPSLRSFLEIPDLVGQQLETSSIVQGAHLPQGLATMLTSYRIMTDSPAWWSHLQPGDTAEGNIGRVNWTESPEGEYWLEFHPASACTLGVYQRMIQSMDALIRLAIGKELTVQRSQIMVSDDDRWLEVISEEHSPTKRNKCSNGSFMSPHTLTLERIARWWEMEQTMDGLSSAVAIPVEDEFIQIQGIVACSLVEGIHKRLVPSKGNPWFVKRAAYLEKRARNIQPDMVAGIGPSQLEDLEFSPWSELVRTVRNDLTHHNPTRAHEVQVLEWMIVESSVRWVLRVCLLDEAGFSHEDIRQALQSSEQFALRRAYIDSWIKERDDLVAG